MASLNELKNNVIENIYNETTDCDTKKILNRSDKVVSKELLDSVENGVTSETLNDCGLPVFKYNTQITIHGQFPTVTKNYIGGYKNVFQNQNGSVGVKYQAIDYAKKVRIYNALAFKLKFRTEHNSTVFSSYYYKQFTHENYKEVELIRQNIRNIFEKVTLPYIQKSIYVAKVPYLGTFLVCEFKVNAIYEKDMPELFNALFGQTETEINVEYAAYKKELDEKRALDNAKYEKEREERQRASSELRAALRLTVPENIKMQENIPVRNGLIIFGTETTFNNQKAQFKLCVYKKDKGQKKLRRITQNFDTFSEMEAYIKAGKFEHWNAQTVSDNATVKKAFVYPTETLETKPTAKVENANVYIVDYSEKAIAVFGDTKAIKDTLKSLGGKFNMYLKNNGTTQAGWIFSKKSESEVRAAIAA